MAYDANDRGSRGAIKNWIEPKGVFEKALKKRMTQEEYVDVLKMFVKLIDKRLEQIESKEGE